ncbi:MAG TPA: four helix bundle protein [Chitinophagaceae bacterium]|jgi:four helix bundle protein|nr:four helix bundle protein [Chitinophagaceae bacterium]
MLERKDNVILNKTIAFSLAIIEYAEQLEEQKKYVISRQLLRSGTSIGANVHEAQNAESKSDFIHKFKIAAKEVEETKYWLVLCQSSKNYPDCKHLISMLEEIEKIITKIISTSKSK